MKRVVILAEHWDASGVFTFTAFEPTEDEIAEIESGEIPHLHTFVGKRMTLYVITPMVEIPRDYALYIATSYADKGWERVVDWKMANNAVTEEIRLYLRRRHDQFHKVKAKKPHHQTNPLSSSIGE